MKKETLLLCIMSIHQPRKMPMKPPSPLANSPTSSKTTVFKVISGLQIRNYFVVTCIELGLVDVAARLDVQIEGGRPVASPVCVFGSLFNKSERPGAEKRKNLNI